MPSKRLTTISVAQIKPRPVRFEVADAGCLGLYLQVQPSGVKGWAVRYRIDGKPAKYTLPGALGLAAARTAASEIRQKVEQGIDPNGEKRAAKAAAEIAAGNTLRAVGEKYLRYEQAKPEGKRLRTIDQRRATFERLIFPVLGGRPIGEIKRGEIVKFLDEIEIVRGGRAADEALTMLKIVFDWHAVRDENFRTPIVRGMARTNPKDRMRSRVLSDDEVRAVWRAADSAGTFGALAQFLLLTATRRNEAARMTWDEFTGSDWLIPAARYKNKQPHLIPLSKAAQAVLAKMPKIVGCPWVFAGGTGRCPFSNFGRAKVLLDQASGVTGWTLHDTRRTGRSLLSRAGIGPDIAERAIGHALAGVRKTYDLHHFYSEKQHAFEALATEIERIVNPPEGDNIVPLRA